MLPAAMHNPADHIEEPPGFEGVEVCALPPARPAIAPPPDDRFELLRYFVVGCCWDYKNAARVLAKRAELGDAEAWEAVGHGLHVNHRHVADVTDELAKGDLDAAVNAAALICGDYVKRGDKRIPVPLKWLRETREERARKGGSR